MNLGPRYDLWLTTPPEGDEGFDCDCAERGVPEEDGCDYSCPCPDCHLYHASPVDAACCRRPERDPDEARDRERERDWD